MPKFKTKEKEEVSKVKSSLLSVKSRRLSGAELQSQQAVKYVYSEDELINAIAEAEFDLFRHIVIASDMSIDNKIIVDVDRLCISQLSTCVLYPDYGLDTLFEIRADYVKLDGIIVPDPGPQNNLETFVYVPDAVRGLNVVNCEIGASDYFLNVANSSALINQGRFQNNLLKGLGTSKTQLRYCASQLIIAGNVAFFAWDLLAVANSRECIIANNTFLFGDINTSAGVIGRNTITGNSYVNNITTAGSDATGGNS